MIPTILAALSLALSPCCPAEPLHAGSLMAFAVTTTGGGKAKQGSGGGGPPPTCSDSLDLSDACNSANIAVILF